MAASPSPGVSPFWLRLPRFFAYPLHGQPLLYMALLAGCSLLVPALPVPYPFDLLIVHAGIWLAFIRYAYGVLEQTALGRLTPDQHQAADDSQRNSLPYKQFGVFLAMGIGVGLVGSLGRFPMFLAESFANLAMPASIMILAMTGSAGAALNPLGQLGVMRAIGLPYLGLCGFLFLLSFGGPQLLMVLGPILPEWLVLPCLNFVLMYFTLIMFNLMGYVLYQYHQELGYGVEVQFEEAREGTKSGGAPEVLRDEAGEAIAGLVAEGKLEQALEIAYEQQRQDPENDLAQERYIKLLLLANKRERFLSQGRHVISRRLRRGRGDAALDAYQRCLAEDPGFEPEYGKEVLLLAEVARQRRDYAGALALVKGFDRRYPQHQDIPAVYFFSAQVLCEHYRQDAAARKLLQVLLARYPEHPLGPEVERYLATLERLSVAQAGT